MTKKWAVKRILILIGFVSFIFLCLFMYRNFQKYQARTGLPDYFSQESLQPSALKFSARGCKMVEAAPTPEQEQLKRIQKTWLNENTLLIKTHVSVQCPLKIQNGNYKVEGNTLILEYGIPSEPGAACKCLHEVSYEITNLQKGDYEIKFLEIHGRT